MVSIKRKRRILYYVFASSVQVNLPCSCSDSTINDVRVTRAHDCRVHVMSVIPHDERVHRAHVIHHRARHYFVRA